jgi:hypothetical protein
MAESNSVYQGGKPGISDTGSSALGCQRHVHSGEARWLGINFHCGGGSRYSPNAETSDGIFEPKPLYYAMLLFAYAARGSLVPIQSRGIRPRLRAFAVRGAGGEHRVNVINMDLGQNERVQLGHHRAVRNHSAVDCTFGGEQVRPHLRWSFGRPEW